MIQPGGWLQILEKSDIIFYLRPYSNNLLKTHRENSENVFFLIPGLLLILLNTVRLKYWQMAL